MQASPKVGSEQEAGFETLEGEHQRRRLTVELRAPGEHLQVLKRGAAQCMGRQLHLFELSVGDDTPAELRPVRVDNGKVAAEVLSHGARIEPVGFFGGEEGDERGTRHLHVGKVATRSP